MHSLRVSSLLDCWDYGIKNHRCFEDYRWLLRSSELPYNYGTTISPMSRMYFPDFQMKRICGRVWVPLAVHGVYSDPAIDCNAVGSMRLYQFLLFRSSTRTYFLEFRKNRCVVMCPRFYRYIQCILRQQLYTTLHPHLTPTQGYSPTFFFYQHRKSRYQP